MNEKVYQILEFHKIIDMLEAKADSAPAKALCKKLHPSADLSEITKTQEDTAAALTRLFRQDRISFAGCTEIRPVCRALEIESALSAADLIRVADILECSQRVYAYGNPDAKDSEPDCLTPYFEQLVLLPDLNREIRRCIISAEEIADDASAKLSSIRKSILSINDKIHDKLAGYVNTSLRPYLQDAVVTMRDNRYCIPVKSEYRGQVAGIVHDQSSTGSTLFIEPAAIVEYNNKIRQLEIEEQEEIAAILRALSERAAAHTAEIANNAKLLTKLDFIFAKASLAMDMNATMPVFNDERIIDIRKGRHPLLDRKKVVPIDVRLGEDFDLLIVTGPNTGGKTVSLKTVGLLTLMGQAGLHIPAADRSRLGIFKEVFADIGDEQSIEQSLSTFSAHMTNIVTILKHADADSLCLFDELGAGTDPTEGAALAIAILTYLHDRGIRSMATTHYSELKIFALSTDYVENACCEFDVKSLRPTYKLLIGIPGKSNAFAISKRLGLSDDIIESAKTHISKEAESFEDVIANLEKRRLEMEREQLEIDKYKRETQSVKDQLKAKQDKLDTSRDKILREANEEAREILMEAKAIADEAIRKFQRLNASSADMRELERSRQSLNSKISEKNSKLSIPSAKPEHHAKVRAADLKPGDSVKIVSMGLKGTVNTLPDASGNLFVMCGIMRTKTNVKDLVLLQDSDDATRLAPSKKTSTGSSMKMSKSMHISTEINLLGKTVDEAIAELDKYLDDAYLSHVPSVRIVHGKGTGALRNAIHQHLKRLKYIDSYRLGEFGEGDSGVTIATFH
ncbi:MAG: endonuclease MutS2 [Lachnospiraceae bacterium]|nr:endonuclease MutS2 [Lachnospiraceae bacterium]